MIVQVAGRVSVQAGEYEGLHRCIKCFGSGKYEGLIDWPGSSMIASVCSGEATYKELKQA